jgi:small-conductance mechanosensitive channel
MPAFFAVAPVAAQPSADPSEEPGENRSTGASPSTDDDEATPGTPRGRRRAYQPNGPARRLPALDTGLPLADPPVDLGSPRATLYNLVSSCEGGELGRAAHSLDLRWLHRARPEEVAHQLCYLLDRRIDVDWSQVSAHPAGMAEGASFDRTPQEPRQNLSIGTLNLDGRPADIRLQRLRPPGRPPIWLFAAPSVARTSALYAAHGPSWVERQLPEQLSQEAGFGFTVWELLFLPPFCAIGFALVWLLSSGVSHIAALAFDSERVRDWIGLIRPPIVLLLTLTLFRTVIGGWLELRGHLVSILVEGSALLTIIAIGWLVMATIQGVSRAVVGRYSVSAEDDQAQDARRALTLNSAARRVALFIVAVIMVGAVLRHLELASTVGSALLGTAGAITVIIAVAAHRVLGNLVTGVQLAVTKPVRIGDSVVFDGNWGRVEQIRYTHLTVRTWDDRRVVVPFDWIMQHPFENWSSVTTPLIKPIYVYVDFGVDVQRVRSFFTEACRSSLKWDPETEPEVLVTAFRERSVELRCTCAARTPSDAWKLHCFLREQLLGFLRSVDAHPDRAWPRDREQRVLPAT